MLTYGFLITILNILTTHALLTRKKSIPYCVVAFCLNTIFVLGMIIPAKIFITSPTAAKYIIFSAAFLYVIYVHLVFRESIQKKIFTMLSICVLSTVCIFAAVLIIRPFAAMIDEQYFDDLIYNFRFLLRLFALAVIYYKMRHSYKRILKLVPDKTVSLMSLYPLIAYLVLINDYPTDFTRFRYFDPPYEMLAFLALIILGYFLVFEGISAASQKISLQYNYKIVENQIELQRQNYKRLNESLEQLHALKHDMRQHFSAIRTMLDEKKYDKVMKYMEQFQRNELLESIPELCENFTADSIIKYYYSMALEQKIEFTAELNIPEDIGMNPLDLCVVLGNCLENAIEACVKTGTGSKKYIRIASQIVNSYLVCKITNSFDGNLIQHGDTLESTKNEASHGIGLSSVRETVHKYKGNLDIKPSNHEFQIEIIMEVPADSI